MNISVIIPAFNEEDNLKILLPKLHLIISPVCNKYELLVIDSKKTADNSEKVCDENDAKYIRQTNNGYGDAFRMGIGAAKYGAVLVVDADNSQDISKIPAMYEALNNGYDIVIGSRYVKGATTKDPFLSVVMSKILNLTYRLVLGFEEKDISTDFRFYKKEMLENITTCCNNFDVIEETLFLIKKKYPDLKIKEIPIDYKQRAEGESKRQLFLFIAGYIKLLIKLFKLRL